MYRTMSEIKQCIDSGKTIELNSKNIKGIYLGKEIIIFEDYSLASWEQFDSGLVALIYNYGKPDVYTKRYRTITGFLEDISRWKPFLNNMKKYLKRFSKKINTIEN